MKKLSGDKLFWVTCFFILYNFTLGPLLFHHGLLNAIDTSIEDIFMALAVWFLIAEKTL